MHNRQEEKKKGTIYRYSYIRLLYYLFKTQIPGVFLQKGPEPIVK